MVYVEMQTEQAKIIKKLILFQTDQLPNLFPFIGISEHICNKASKMFFLFISQTVNPVSNAPLINYLYLRTLAAFFFPDEIVKIREKLMFVQQ